MTWKLAFAVLGVPVAQAVAQFPLHRTLEVNPGQQRPAITSIVQDSMGLLWVGSDMGILRTDGERVDRVLLTDDAGVNALAADGAGVVAALSNGVVLRCVSDRCDTVLADTDLALYPVRAMLRDAKGCLYLATYGSGLWTVDHGRVVRFSVENGLPDDHVNGLAALPDGRVVAATDQGLAIHADGRVVEVFDGARGAPDNLVLCVASDADGRIYAGTDGHGVFSWMPGSSTAHTLGDAWDKGPVTSITVHAGMIWAGTKEHGAVLMDVRERVFYSQRVEQSGPARPCSGLFPDREGAVWWCDGSERIHRVDPAILFVPEHEGTDMRSITALCVDGHDRIWFATREGLQWHSTAFSENAHLKRIPLVLDHHTPIVSLAAAADGTVWAATFGAGVHAITPDGRSLHFDRSDGLGNDNVLAVRTEGDTVWFATLEGITRWHAGRFEMLDGTAGFAFDVLPDGNGGVFIATDGRGLLRWPGGAANVSTQARTFYSLVRDDQGGVWACGPSTGLCNTTSRSLACVGAGRAPFDGDLFALGWMNGHAIAFGHTGTVALSPSTGRWTDLTARLGLEGIQAELNVIAHDDHDALWFACDRGLVRLKLDQHHFEPDVEVIITELQINGVQVPIATRVRSSYDRNDINVRFTGLYYADPAALRFEYRLDDGRVVRTRDRELALPGLEPGAHVLRLRAFVGEPGPLSAWSVLEFEIDAPWWRRPAVLVPLALLVVAIVYVIARARERRLRERDRVEQEKVRFQLEALRSQVDPHFLFNSFNTLVALIETDSEKAVEHVDALSAFFRSMLVVRDKDVIPLNEEIDLVKGYFGLEQRRFGKAIDLFVTLPADVHRYRIVPLTLQLLVENALKHNAATMQQPLHIHIDVVGNVLSVRNGISLRASMPRSTGFGLDSIIKRYAVLTAHPVEVVREAGSFTVRIPLLQDDGHSDH